VIEVKCRLCHKRKRLDLIADVDLEVCKACIKRMVKDLRARTERIEDAMQRITPDESPINDEPDLSCDWM